MRTLRQNFSELAGLLLSFGATYEHCATMKRSLPGRAVITLAAALMLATATSPAAAAPATSDELSATSDIDAGARAAGGRSGSGVPVAPPTTVPQSKTVELLLQLQDQPNTYSGANSGTPDQGRRPAKVDRDTGSGAKAQAPQQETNPLLNLKASILGPAQQRQSEQQDQRLNPEMAATARQEAADRAEADRGTREQAATLLSNPVVRYLRENRGWVVSASLAALAAVWLTANFSLRRSR